jgi:hypothetical protein
MLTMLLGGLWHGAAWTFVIWGAFHGLLLAIHRFFVTTVLKTSHSTEKILPYMLKAFIMFHLTCLGWVFFRAQSFDQVELILHQIFTGFSYTPAASEMLTKVLFFSAMPILVMTIETLKALRPLWFSDNFLLKYFHFSDFTFPLKSIAYATLSYLLCFYGAKAQAFIYFQF